MALSGTARKRITYAVANASTATEIADAIDANSLKTSAHTATDITLSTTTAELTTSYAKELIAEIYNNLKDAGHFA